MHAPRLAFAALVLLRALAALILRLYFFEVQTSDFTYYVQPWYETLREFGFSAFRFAFYNYAPLYLYALFAVSALFPRVSAIFAVKALSVLFDFVCAALVAKIVSLKYSQKTVAWLAGLAVLFAPTVVLNGSFWGQADAVYTSALLASLYLLLTRRQIPAMVAFGVAFALKQQALFLAPLLLVMCLKRQLAWKTLLLIPAVYVVTLIPAWLAGRPFGDLLTIYAAQFDTYQGLTLNAPNAYQWLPVAGESWVAYAGLAVACVLVGLFVLLVWKSPTRLSGSLTIHAALISALIVPFVLPRMHERYFFP